MTAYAFDQIIDFTRTSAATYVANTGFVTQTPASRNLLTYTQEFDNAAWTKTDTTVTANNALAPDGNSTADTLTEGSAGTGQVGSTGSVPSAGATATYSIYLKRGNTDWVRIQVLNGANGFRAWFNLSTGAVGTSAAVGTGSLTGASIASAGDGWYRCILAGAIPSVTAYSAFTNTTSADNSSTRVSGGTYLAWGTQLETGSTATSYTRNFGGLFPPRFDYDPVTLAPRGLLIEEQRTNLLTGSDDFTATYWPTTTNVVVTANNTTSPDGTSNADLLADNTAASAEHRLFRSYTFTAAAHTLSLYVKRNTHQWLRLFFFDGTTSFYANFDLLNGVVGKKHASVTSTITAVGNSWFRVTMTATTAAAAGNVQLVMLNSDSDVVPAPYTGTGTSLWIYGAQLEAGAFATSYIPTVASQVTRTADQAAVTGANFSRWYNQSEGTFVVEMWLNALSTVANQTAVIAQTDTSNLIVVRANQAGGQRSATVVTAGVNQGFLDIAGTAANVVQKLGYAYRTNDTAFVVNGGTPATDNTVTLPTVNTLYIGATTTGNYTNGHIRRIRYYPTRLSNAQLQALTA